MPLSDIVNVVITTQNPGVTQAGFGIPLILSHTAAWAERTRTYNNIADVGADFAVNDAEYLAAAKIFSQSPAPPTIMIGRAANKPTQRFTVGVFTPVIGALYKMRVAAKNVLAWASQDFSHTAVASTTWTITTLYAAGALVTNDTGKLYVATIGGTSAGAGGPTGVGPAPIVDGTVTWVYAGAGGAGVVSNDAIIYNLKFQLDALAAPVVSGVGAAQFTTSVVGLAGVTMLRVTANTAAVFFGLQVYDIGKLSIAQDHADPGVAADLTAIALESSAWYGLITLFNSELLIKAAAGFVESNTKLYPVASQDSEIATVADGIALDVFHDLKALSYARTAPFYHPANDEFADAAEIGRFFPIDPGGDNWRLKTLSGVTVQQYTATQTTNINAKNANYYYILGGANVIGGDGKVSANEYIDVIRFRDWWVARTSERLANLLIQNEKIPYTDPGVALIEAEVRAQNQEGIDAGGISDSPAPTVTVPKVASVSLADKQARRLRNVNTAWVLAGAINDLTVNAQISA